MCIFHRYTYILSFKTGYCVDSQAKRNPNIVYVHIYVLHCSKLLKVMRYTQLPMVGINCAIKMWAIEKKGHDIDIFVDSSCRHYAEDDSVKSHSLSQ